MIFVYWALYGILVLLTYLWFFLIWRDSRAYLESQVKVLGEENRFRVDTKRLKFYFWTYFVLLTLLLGVFFIVLYTTLL